MDWKRTYTGRNWYFFLQKALFVLEGRLYVIYFRFHAMFIPALVSPLHLMLSF